MPRDNETNGARDTALDKELGGHFFEDLKVGMTDV